MKYLDQTGLAHLWDQITSLVDDGVVYIGTSTPPATARIWINPNDGEIINVLTAAQATTLIQQELGVIENGTY